MGSSEKLAQEKNDDSDNNIIDKKLTFLEKRYPVARLLVLRATLKRIIDLYQQAKSHPFISDSDKEEPPRVKTEGLIENEKKELLEYTEGDLSVRLTQSQARHYQIKAFIKHYQAMDQQYDNSDDFNPGTTYINTWKQNAGGGLFAGWLTARRFIAAWFPGKHTLTELSILFTKWWQSAEGKNVGHHPREMRKRLVKGDTKHSIDCIARPNYPTVIKNFQKNVCFLLFMCRNLFQDIDNIADKASDNDSEHNDLATPEKEELLAHRNHYQHQIAILKEIARSIFPDQRQRMGDVSTRGLFIFTGIALLGVTLIGMTLLAKFGILGVLAIQFAKLPIIAHGLNILTTFLTNAKIYPIITQTPQILMFSGAACVYLAGWCFHAARYRTNFLHFSHWLQSYWFVADAMCNTWSPLDTYASAFLKDPTRRSFFYLPGEQTKDGADIPWFFMTVKTVLNPLRLVRAALVLTHWILLLPFLALSTYFFPKTAARERSPKLFLTSFMFAGVVDFVGHLVIKPLEGLIRLFDVTYDYVLPLVGKALMTPVILAYGCYGLFYSGKTLVQAFIEFFKQDDSQQTEYTATIKPDSNHSTLVISLVSENPIVSYPATGHQKNQSPLLWLRNIEEPLPAKGMDEPLVHPIPPFVQPVSPST